MGTNVRRRKPSCRGWYLDADVCCEIEFLQEVCDLSMYTFALDFLIGDVQL